MNEVLEIKADKFPQRGYHWLFLMALGVLTFVIILDGPLLVISVLFLLVFWFYDEIIAQLKRERRDKFLTYDGETIEITPYTYLNGGTVKVCVSNVLKVRESGKRGDRKFLFMFKNGQDKKVDIKIYLDKSFNQEIEDEFFEFLKNVFGELEHIYII